LECGSSTGRHVAWRRRRLASGCWRGCARYSTTSTPSSTRSTHSATSRPGCCALRCRRQRANLLLAPLLARFLAQYPAIDLEISVDAALTDIVAGRFDAGIRPGERVERDMIAVRIGEEFPGVVVAAPNYLEQHPRPSTPRDLQTHNCIRFRFPSGVIVPWQFEKKGKKAEVAVEGRLTVNDPDLAIRAALDGVGVLYTALGYAAAEIKAGRLVPLLEDWRIGSSAFFLYYPSRRQVPLPLQVFIEFLRENLPTT